MVIVLNESLLHQNGQDIGCRLAVPLLLAAIVLLEGDGVVAQQLLHEGIVQTGHDIFSFCIRLLVDQIKDVMLHQVIVGQQQVGGEEDRAPSGMTRGKRTSPKVTW